MLFWFHGKKGNTTRICFWQNFFSYLLSALKGRSWNRGSSPVHARVSDAAACMLTVNGCRRLKNRTKPQAWAKLNTYYYYCCSSGPGNGRNSCQNCPGMGLPRAGKTRPALFYSGCWYTRRPISCGPGARLHPGEEHNGIRFYGNVYAPAM